MFNVLNQENTSPNLPPFSTFEKATMRDKEFIIDIQKKKVGEMRRSQMDFFDSKMIELQDKQTDIDAKLSELKVFEQFLHEREHAVADQLKRIEIEKMEVRQIRELLKTENESIRISSADLKQQIDKYERIIKMMMRTKQVIHDKDRLESANTPELVEPL